MNHKDKIFERLKALTPLGLLAVVMLLMAPFWLGDERRCPALRKDPNNTGAEAIPAFARKYNVDCSVCHTVWPRLSRTGYEFRRLGFRFPDEVEAAMKKKRMPATSSFNAPPGQPILVPPTGYVAKAATDESEQGKKLFDKLNCAGCHTVSQVGGLIGPPLDGVGGRRDEQFLVDHLTNPEEHTKKFAQLYGGQPNLMPHPHASVEEVKQLVAYLETLPEPAHGFIMAQHPESTVQQGPITSRFYPHPQTDSSREGQKLINQSGCMACHSISGIGGKFGPAFDGIGARRSRKFITSHIINPQAEPKEFPEEGQVSIRMPPARATHDEIEKMVDYLLTLPELRN